ncbi:VWA domain-containing protein [Chryseobacterium flavum]|uniref:VWA domain-containing protein n=1 Tax=Chryseobacterium flavum TaxID=415851 RepID=A0A3D9CQK1_9FLAO|nr:VWA domain-containing protein [Chryseobacterium flavum]REC68063.1 VWA domain-containing protein [Chryseobacterium flavum]
MENNHIDQQFSEASRLSDEPTVFPGFEKVWEKIEEKLDQKKEKRRIVPFWLPYGVAASLMVGSGAFYFLNKEETLQSNSSMLTGSIIKETVPDNHIAQIDHITKENIRKEKQKIEPATEKVAVNTNKVSVTSSDILQPVALPLNRSSSPEFNPVINEYQIQTDKNSSQENDTHERTQEIEEVVMTAFGIKKTASSVTGAATISGSGNMASQSVASALQGSVAGIQITPASGISGKRRNEIKNTSDHLNKGYFNRNEGQVIIRGVASVRPENQPLYVINGEVVPDGVFRSLDPGNIEDVKVLKDTSAAAIYGSRGANGVIVVKTKKLSGKEKRKMKRLQEEISRQKQVFPISDNESYDAFVENPFELTNNQPLSTFSIDVDNASYSNIRRMINNGQPVDKNAVRIEEMVNYFKYDYPQPQNGVPFSISTEYNEAPWNPGHKLLKIGLQGKNIPTDHLPASNFIFLIDVSGSMDAPNKLPLLKSSFRVLLNQMRSKDKVGIVVYAGSAGMVLPPTSAGEKEKIIQALDRLQAGGSTAGGAGIELAYKLAQEHFVKAGNNRVIIATDGDFNVGMSSASDLKTLIEEKRKSGVFLTCLGFGMGNYKDNTLETLADKGNGNYAYIDNLQEANKFLGKEFTGSMYTIAKDVKIQIEFNPEFVQSYRLIGYENRKLENEDFVNDKIDAGELGSGHTVTALYEIIPAGTRSEFLSKDSELKYSRVFSSNQSGDELATVKFRYKKPDEDTSRELIHVVKNADQKISSASRDFKFASSVAWFGLVLRNSNLIKGKDLRVIENLAKEGKGNDEDGYRSEFLRLIETYKTGQK